MVRDASGTPLFRGEGWGLRGRLTQWVANHLLASACEGASRRGRNGAQVFVDRPQVAVGHTLKNGPRHNLKQTAKRRVRVIEIDASSQHQLELVEGEAVGKSVLLRGEVA
jgi:hypothetical protein